MSWLLKVVLLFPRLSRSLFSGPTETPCPPWPFILMPATDQTLLTSSLVKNVTLLHICALVVGWGGGQWGRG